MSLRPFVFLIAALLTTGSGTVQAQRGSGVAALDNAASHASIRPDGVPLITELVNAYLDLGAMLTAPDSAFIQRVHRVDSAVSSIEAFILTSSSGYYQLHPARDSLRSAVGLFSDMAPKDDGPGAYRFLTDALTRLLRKVKFQNPGLIRLCCSGVFDGGDACWYATSRKAATPYPGYAPKCRVVDSLY